LVGRERLELAQKAHLGQFGRPRFPWPLIRWQIERIIIERSQRDPELLAHRGERPSDHVIGLVSGSEPIGPLVLGVIVGRPRWEVVAVVDGRLQPGDEG
jgi:hypothetical protein